MRKIIKKVISISLLLMLSASTLIGCGKEQEEETTIDKSSLTPQEYYNVASWDEEEYEVSSDDHYRNYYEVFVYSFADSDGDGIGDIQGLISKLDYIEEMGFNGIWLMPIMPSTTYHKYDITDYYGIDSEYGTLEDFMDLIDKCHARNINVIIDTVFNHTSSKHEWFTTAVNYYKSLGAGEEPDYTVCPEANYYNFMKTEDVSKSSYIKISGSEWSYEGVFWSEMPDLNLDNPVVREELQKVIDYWLNIGVDGFRLDASKEYTTGNKDKNKEVLSWIESYVTSVREDAYIVAEIWDTYSNISNYYKSGIESIFDFAYGDSSGLLITSLNTANGKRLSEKLESTESGYLESNSNMVNAPFVSNHDIGRISGFVSYDLDKMKLVGAINQIMSGCSFVYYGEEIGMTGSGADKDENKRAPMNWSSFKGGVTTVGPKAMDSDVASKFEPVDSQMEDIDSIYWYYRKIIHIRSTYEEIAKGSTKSLELDNETVCSISKTYNDETIYILCNLSNEEQKVTLSKNDYEYSSMVEYMVTNTDQEVKLDGDVITLPPYGIAFIK